MAAMFSLMEPLGKRVVHLAQDEKKASTCSLPGAMERNKGSTSFREQT